MFEVNALYQQHVVRYLLRICNVEQNILIPHKYDCVQLLLVIKAKKCFYRNKIKKVIYIGIQASLY